MALSDLILSKGQIIVILSSGSSTGLVPPEGGQALNFGTVQKVYDTSDKTTVGQNVVFNPDEAIQFMIISGTTFYVINEDNIRIKEPTAP